MPVNQTIQFEAVSLREIGSGSITAELFQGSTSRGSLAAIAEDATRNGRYTGTVTDKTAGAYDLQVKFSGYTVSEPNLAVDLLLSAGTYVAARANGLNANQADQLNEIHEAFFPPDPDDSPLVITPSDPGKVTGYAVCYGLDGEAAAGIVVTYKLQSPPARDVGRILNGSTTGTRTSASNGLITFPGLFPGSTYYFTCGSTTVSITIPLDADSETGYELPSFKKT
jgi:hypothetical protein